MVRSRFDVRAVPVGARHSCSLMSLGDNGCVATRLLEPGGNRVRAGADNAERAEERHPHTSLRLRLGIP